MIKLENIQNIYINGKRSTTAKRYELLDCGNWLYIGNVSIKGWYKKESTILKKLND